MSLLGERSETRMETRIVAMSKVKDTEDSLKRSGIEVKSGVASKQACCLRTFGLIDSILHRPECR